MEGQDLRLQIAAPENVFDLVPRVTFTEGIAVWSSLSLDDEEATLPVIPDRTAGVESALRSIWSDQMKAVSRTEAGSRLLEQLIVTISRLARPAEHQAAYLDSLAPDLSPDELALELDDVASAALQTPGLLSAEQERLVRALDDLLATMSGAGQAEIWSREALVESPRWAAVREQARSALTALHSEPAARP